jgi:hypothetical protein
MLARHAVKSWPGMVRNLGPTSREKPARHGVNYASGVRHALIGVNIVQIEDGKFREVRAYFDPSALA